MLFDNILEWRRVKEMDGLLKAGGDAGISCFLIMARSFGKAKNR
jgi:hypothetical protein